MPTRVNAAPGRTLDGRFLLIEEIGRGGMATVWKAEDKANGGALVAVKVPLPQYSSGVGSWSMFQREAEIGAKLRHPSILRFVDPPHRRSAYVVTEYVPGVPLADRVGKGRFLAEREALSIVSRVCDAVQYLHEHGIVHYDLKPANVILCDDGSIRLIDFGMAHGISRHRFSFPRSAPPIASADYVAPEQIRRVPGRPSVDVYALGAMLYEMLTGQPPFAGDDPFVVASARQIGDPVAPRALNPAISRQAEEIVLRALQRNPADRYGSVAALGADLDHVSDVLVSGLADRLVAVTKWRKGAAWIRYVALVGVLPLAILAAMFRLLWWYLERRH